VSGSLVADLGLGPKTWLFLTLLATVTVYFKFGRFWSVRNLDLLLLFAPAPGMMRLVGQGAAGLWMPFVWLFLGAALWLTRCLLDLGLTRRPLLEPNLNASGLTCVAVGLLGLLLFETVTLEADQGAARNPAEPRNVAGPEAPLPVAPRELEAPVQEVIRQSPLPTELKRSPLPVILSRVLASLAHLALVVSLVLIGRRHYDRPVAGLAVAVAYLLSPYTRIAVVDSGQLVPAALIVGALLYWPRAGVAGALIGLAGGWMPPCLGLIPLWAGFYGGRNAWRFLAGAVGIAVVCAVLPHLVPGLDEWARALGARSLGQAGLVPGVEAPPTGSFWSRIEPAYRLPILIVYLAMVFTLAFWPARKNLGELIAMSAALLVATQFWYLDEGGTLILLYLPLMLLMMFRPNLNSRLPERVPLFRPRAAGASLSPSPSSEFS
jgi:hypothetical protein